jgi:hypothetical protein
VPNYRRTPLSGLRKGGQCIEMHNDAVIPRHQLVARSSARTQ